MLRRRHIQNVRPLAKSLSKLSSAAAICAALVASSGHAAPTWTAGSATDLSWSTPTNWDTGIEPTALDAVIFGPVPAVPGADVVTLLAGELALSLNFGDSYTLSGGDLTLGAGGNITVAATETALIQSTLAGAGGLTKAGDGVLRLGGANTFVGPIAINGGTLSVSGNGNLGDVANTVSLSNATLEVAGGTIDRSLALGAGAILTGTGAASSSVGTATVAVGATVRLNSGTAGQVFTIGNAANDLTGGGAGTNILVGGNGTVALTNANDVTANWVVNTGTLRTDSVTALGTGTVTVQGGSTLASNSAAGTFGNKVILNGGTLSQLLGNTLTIGAGNLQVDSASTVNVALANPGKIFVNAGGLLGSGALTKTGAGILQLGGANSYTGNWTVSGGFLEAAPGGLGTGSVTVNTGGELVGSNGTFANAIIMNGGTISGDNGNSTYSGSINAAGNFSVGLRDFFATATPRTLTVSGPISGSGNINVVGATAAGGVLNLNGTNAGYTGIVTAGTNTTVNVNSLLGSTAGLGFTGGTIALRAVNAAGVGTAGVAGINTSYYNVGLDAVASGNPTTFASFMLVEPQRVFTRVESAINLPNGGGGTHPVVPVPGYQFNVNDAGMWKGVLNITNAVAGGYQFSAINDDQAVLFIDGVQIGTIGVNAAGANVGTPVILSAGAHSIVWKFSQGGGGGYTSLRYNGGAGSDAPTTAIVGSVPGSLTTGSLAPVEVGSLNAVSGTSTFDTGTDVRAATFTGAGGATLNLTSGTISDITITGASTLTGTGALTINPNTASITFNGGISGTAGLTFNGLYSATFKSANTYAGATTVSGGRLTLDSGTGDSVPGNLTINAANALGRVRNVVLNQSNQIGDAATVAVTSGGILDIGANSDTVGTLQVNGVGAEVIGSGTITATTLDLRQGLVSANLHSTGGVTKNTAGTITLSGANTYTGTTTISAGAINIRSATALGATGAGNGTVVLAGGQLQIQGDVTTAEAITINGNTADGTGALRLVSGDITLSGLTLGSSASVQVDTGVTTIAGPVNGVGNTLTVQGDGVLVVGLDPVVTGLSVVKNGRGALVYGSTLGAFPTVTHNAGVIGFVGTQNLGAITVPAGLSYLFSGDPGAGTTVNVPAGTSLLNDGGGTSGVLSRVGTGAGAFVLTTNSAANLNFTGKAVGLGALGLVNYSGTITPDASGYNFTGLQGGIGDGIAPNRLSLTAPLSGTNSLLVKSGVVNLTGVSNTQSGAITVGQDGVVEVLNNPNLGAAANGITLDGGTLRLINLSGSAGQIFGHLGNAVNGGSRIVTIGSAGGTIDVPTFGNGNNGYMLGGNFSTALSGDPLEGTGTLTKTGLGYLFLTNASDFAGNIRLTSSGGLFDIRGAGSWVPSVPTTITVGQSANFQLDTRSNLGSGRQIANQNIVDRVGDNVNIVMEGGNFQFFARNVAAQVTENFAKFTIGTGQNAFNGDKEGQGEDHTIGNLVTLPGGTLRFGGDSGTFGATGDNVRIILTQVNGVAPTASHIGGFATIFGTSFVGHGATGVAIANGTDQGAAAFAPVAATVYNLNVAATATISDEVDNIAEMLALRFGNNAGQTLAFTDVADTLYVGGGGILSDGSNQTRAIGGAVNQGRLTAGAVGATGLQQLFFHNNANTLTVNSNIVDNSGTAPVAVVKSLDGQVTLAAANTYTGGTYVTRGTLQANVAGSLGSGAVTVKNARLNLQVAGTSTGTAGFTAVDNGEIFLNNATGVFTSAGDRFVINPGSTIIGPNGGNANQGLNSLTRVFAAPANGGDIQLLPGAIVGHQFNAVGEIGTGATTIKNLGNSADLFFGLSATFSDPRTTVTVGAGTPWKGISTDRAGRTWEEGSILANSDFWLQGLTRDGGVAILQLGSGSTGTYGIVNQAGRSINAYVSGQVVLAEDSQVSLPSNLTFVLTAGSLLQPNVTSSLGSNLDISQNAKVRVLAGGTFDPGNYVGVGAVVNQPQGIPYPVASPANGLVTVEAGGRFINNDASGIGSTTPGAWTIKTDGILELGNAQSFLGANGGLINDGQFVYEPGAIARFSADVRVFKLDQFVNSAPNGTALTYQIFNGDRNLTDAVDPRIVAAVGTRTVTAFDLTIGAGGMLTNDNSDRVVRQRRGSLLLTDGATIAGTTQTYFNIQEDFAIAAGATINIGSTRWVDGQPKLGSVQLNGAGAAVNTAGAGATVNVVDGAQISFANVHVFPDNAALNLPAAVTAFPSVGGSSPQPGNGSSLLLNTANYLEVIGTLTGNGAVFSNNNADGTGLGVGWGAASDFTFDGVFKNGGTYINRSPSLVKVGPTKMTLTNLNDTPGSLTAFQGELSLAGANGKWVGGEMRLGRGGVLTFDNSVVAVADRQSALGTGNRWITTLGGGEFRVLGHATQVADVTVFGLANGAGAGAFGIPGNNPGGFGKVTILPAAGTTSLTTSVTFGTVERFDNTGERKSVWLIRGTGVGGLPGTYNTTGVYTPNPANPVDGAVFISDPNFIAANTYDASGTASGIVFGAPGTPVAPVRGDLLASSNPNAVDGDFATIDIAIGAARTGVRALQASEYALTAASNASLPINVRATGAQAYTGDTRIQVLKLENGASVGVSGNLPNLTQPSQIMLNGGGILVPAGANANLTATGSSVIRSNAGLSAYLHTFGNLNVSGNFYSDLGIVKTGAGTATFAAGSLDGLRGRVTIHEGTVVLNDSLGNNRGTGQSAVGWSGVNVALNSGTLDLNGKSQLFNIFESGNILPGASTEGGTLTSATPATVIIQGGGAFSGHINGLITLDKVSNNNLLLTNANNTSGNLTIRQGTLILRDSATFPNVGVVDLNYARLDVDNGYLTGQNDRINPSAVYNLRNGDYMNRGRAGALTQEHLGTVNLVQGQSQFQSLPGGGGATETVIGTFNRLAGATVTFNQNNPGFIGTAGNDTTAIRYLMSNISVNGGAASTPAALMVANNGILGGWAIVNNDHFATYDSLTGVSYMSNLEDGYRTYDSGDVTTAGATANVNDGTAARTIAASKTINSLRLVPGAAQTITIGANQTLTINTGGLLTQANQAITVTGGSITSNSGELNVFVNQSTTTIASQITGNIALTKAGGATLSLTGNNNYTGATYFQNNNTSTASGTVTLNTANADGTATVAIPGDLHIHGTTVTELLPHQIKSTANVTLYGGSILNMRDVAALTETLASLTFADASGDANNRAIVTRATARADSTLNLTAPIAITANNTNPTSHPSLSVNLGNVAFTGPNNTAQTLLVNSPVGANGNAAIGLFSNASIGAVPTGVAEGGLVKAGNGLLVLNGTSATQFGNPAAVTEVFNIQTGYVRIDHANALGPVTAVTTVQNGAVLLLNNNVGITGSVRLKDGARLGSTITASLLGAVGSTGFLDIPAGATVQIDAFDSLIPNTTFPNTNPGNITVNHVLTGSGTINQVGIEYASGYNGGGFLQLRNVGNTFSGLINVGTNAVLEANPNDADLSGNTFGTASINLNGGVLRVRDQADNLAGAQTIPYGNNVTLSANSMIDVDRQGTVATNKTIAFGTLTIASGTQVLSTPYGTGAPITANGYRASFSEIAGAGTFVKGGSRAIDINGYAAGFSGNIEVDGPEGLSLPTSGNLTLNAATNSINNLTVRGFHSFAPAKAVNIANTLEVGNNAGQVVNGLNGVTNGGIVGAVTLNSTSAVSANLVRNRGIIGSDNSTASLTSAAFVGSGVYQAYGQPLTLNGTFADDGASPTRIKAIGTGGAAVVLTSPGSANTGGAEIQAGLLRIAPTGGTATNPLGTGAIRVLGAPATTLGAGSQPVAAQATTLEFAGTSISQASNITNTGTLRVASGNTTIAGVIQGTAGIDANPANFLAATVPGLLEGRLTTTGGLPDTSASAADFTAARPANPGNFGVQLEPRMGQMNVVTQNGLTGWSDNTSWIYTGYFFDADGVFTFSENVDDNAMISIDGVTRLLNNSGTNPWQTVTSTATTLGQRGSALDGATVNTGTPQGIAAIPANPNLPAGWHSIEVRIFNGGGGAGPVAGNGFTTNYGFGLNPNGTTALDGTQFSRPIDPGDGTLFRTGAAGNGNIEVGAAGNGAAVSLSATGVTRAGIVTLNGGATNVAPAKLSITGAGSHDANGLTLAGGATSFGSVDLASNSTLTVGALTVPDGGQLTVNEGTGTGNLTVAASHALAATSKVILEAGTLRFNGTGGAVGAEVQVFSGATVNVGGSLTGTVVVSGGTLAGNGTVLGPVSLTGGGTLSPGNSPGVLTVQSLVADASSTFAFEIGGPGAGFGYDQLKVTGDTINLDGATLSLSVTSPVIPNSILNIVLNQGLDLDTGSFGNYGQGQQFTLPGGEQLRISYFDDPATTNVLELSGGSSVSLLVVVPEPGSAMLLLGGLGSLVAIRRRRQS